MPEDEQIEEPKSKKGSSDPPILKKLDALTKKIDALEEKLAPEQKEDADPRDALIKKGAEAFRGILADALPKEKLDAMSFEELLIAHELKSKLDSAKPKEVGNELKGKEDAKKDVSYAEKMRGVVFK